MEAALRSYLQTLHATPVGKTNGQGEAQLPLR